MEKAAKCLLLWIRSICNLKTEQRAIKRRFTKEMYGGDSEYVRSSGICRLYWKLYTLPRTKECWVGQFVETGLSSGSTLQNQDNCLLNKWRFRKIFFLPIYATSSKLETIPFIVVCHECKVIVRAGILLKFYMPFSYISLFLLEQRSNFSPRLLHFILLFHSTVSYCYISYNKILTLPFEIRLLFSPDVYSLEKATAQKRLPIFPGKPFIIERVHFCYTMVLE